MKTIGAAQFKKQCLALLQSRMVGPRKDDDYVNSTGQFQELCR